MIAAQNAVAAARRDLEARQKAAAPKVEALYAALAEAKWPQILAAAEAVLAAIPEHPAARQARARAWQQIAAIGPVGRRPVAPARGPLAPGGRPDGPGPGARGRRRPDARRPAATAGPRHRPPRRRRGRGDRLAERRRRPARPHRPASAPRPTRNPAPARPLARAEAAGPKGRFLLWVDAVGGYLVCLDDRIVLGRAGPDSPADVPLMGDLSRNHATLVRSGESYMLQAHHPSFVNGKPVADQPCSATAT